MTQQQSLADRFRALATSIGPGIFIIGYIIGTGSVTTMASAGANYGMSMTWALALSCFFTYVTIVSISRTTIVTGETLIYTIRSRFGNAVAIFIILSLMLTVTTSIMGVMGIATDVFREWTRPMTASGYGVSPVVSCAAFTAILYFLFLRGTHKLLPEGDVCHSRHHGSEFPHVHVHGGAESREIISALCHVCPPKRMHTSYLPVLWVLQWPRCVS